jgi:hypothetical protein
MCAIGTVQRMHSANCALAWFVRYGKLFISCFTEHDRNYFFNNKANCKYISNFLVRLAFPYCQCQRRAWLCFLQAGAASSGKRVYSMKDCNGGLTGNPLGFIRDRRGFKQTAD